LVRKNIVVARHRHYDHCASSTIYQASQAIDVALRFWLFQRPTIDFHEVCPCASARTVEDELEIEILGFE
jgi:hypothetical protein